MADETEIVKLKTIVNLKSRQAGFRAKKRCGRGESREAEGRGRRNLRQVRRERREKRGGGAMRREENDVGGRQNGDESREGRGRECTGDGAAGGKMQGKRRRGKAGEGQMGEGRVGGRGSQVLRIFPLAGGESPGRG